jgi:hypothetical protein
MRPAGTERAPRRPLTWEGALIPVGVDLRQDGAPEGKEFPGAGAPRAPQFRFGPLDCVGGSEARDKFGDGGAEGAIQQARPSRKGIRLRSISDMEVPDRLSDERSS